MPTIQGTAAEKFKEHPIYTDHYFQVSLKGSFQSFLKMTLKTIRTEESVPRTGALSAPVIQISPHKRMSKLLPEIPENNGACEYNILEFTSDGDYTGILVISVSIQLHSSLLLGGDVRTTHAHISRIGCGVIVYF